MTQMCKDPKFNPINLPSLHTDILSNTFLTSEGLPFNEGFVQICRFKRKLVFHLINDLIMIMKLFPRTYRIGPNIYFHTTHFLVCGKLSRTLKIHRSATLLIFIIPYNMLWNGPQLFLSLVIKLKIPPLTDVRHIVSKQITIRNRQINSNLNLEFGWEL